MSIVEGKTLKRQRLQLVGLALLFLAPVLLSWVAWKYIGSEGVSSTTNAGRLVSPAQPLPDHLLTAYSTSQGDEDVLRRHWGLVMFARSECAEPCERRLYETRQIRTAVNKDIKRVRRVLVVGYSVTDAWSQVLREQHPDLILVSVPETAWEEVTAAFRDANSPGIQNGHVYMVDPLGNYMMHYDPEVTPRSMQKDLTKLLKISQIG